MKEVGSSRPLLKQFRSIAVIGGGFSGCAVSAQILRLAGEPLDIYLIEKDVPARGAAYGTRDLGHLLNVPAGQMSAWPDDPGHFLRWLNEKSPGVGFEEGARADGAMFAPRHFYGRYIEFVLREAEAAARGDVRLHHVKDEAVAVKREKGRV
ncbi:MAG: FAD/NAD(P)-binding protein, partial [Elusimicrobia bacterium]|nr:FAD/NAD(P)-binding protein [Elusimicrobiota bacterium]